uniref:Uncharacterized protein n=1 Tax=Kalanchoe fedtschenkoi TaxID=63787 RepID=A0A7N0V1S2_KALFE
MDNIELTNFRNCRTKVTRVKLHSGIIVLSVEDISHPSVQTPEQILEDNIFGQVANDLREQDYQPSPLAHDCRRERSFLT